jgi:hypothetical protein
MKSAVAVLVAQLAIAGLAVAQDPAPAEFSRASGGEIGALVKRPNGLSLSLGMTSGTNLKQYESSLGGTVIQDRLWFFSAAQTTQRGVGKVSAPFTDHQNLAASVARPLPSSFLSLHSTGIASSKGFFSATVSRESARPQPAFMHLGPTQ